MLSFFDTFYTSHKLNDESKLKGDFGSLVSKQSENKDGERVKEREEEKREEEEEEEEDLLVRGRASGDRRRC